MNSNQTPPPGSVTLTPAAMAFGAIMLVVGAIGGYTYGTNQASSEAPAPATADASTAAADKDGGLQGNVVNNTGGSIRRLSEAEKQELLAGKKPEGDKKAAPAPPPRTRASSPPPSRRRSPTRSCSPSTSGPSAT